MKLDIFLEYVKLNVVYYLILENMCKTQLYAASFWKYLCIHTVTLTSVSGYTIRKGDVSDWFYAVDPHPSGNTFPCRLKKHRYAPAFSSVNRAGLRAVFVSSGTVRSKTSPTKMGGFPFMLPPLRLTSGMQGVSRAPTVTPNPYFGTRERVRQSSYCCQEWLCYEDLELSWKGGALFLKRWKQLKKYSQGKLALAGKHLSPENM